MKLFFPNGEMVGIFGPVASGKTFLIKEWLKQQNRFVVFDYSGEMMESDYECIAQSPASVLRRLQQNKFYFRIAYVPGPFVDADFKWVLWSLWLQDVDKLLVCDEIHRICPLALEKASPMETLLRFARHDLMSLIGASQRIADVSKLFTSACRTIVLFKTDEINDLNAIDDRWGCGEMVQRLRPLIYDDRRKVTLQIPQAVICRKGQAPIVFDFAA